MYQNTIFHSITDSVYYNGFNNTVECNPALSHTHET